MKDKDVDYWEHRKVQRMWEHMQSAEDTANEIAKYYWKASGYLNHQLDEIFNRFKIKHQLSNAEAYRLLNMMHDRTSVDELHRLLKQETDSDERKELLKMIESPAYSARIQRLESIQDEIDILMKNTYKVEKERSTRHYASLTKDAYYKSIYDVQKKVGLAFSFTHISAKDIDKLLHSKWSGINYSKRIWNNTQKLAQDLKEELIVNFMTGRTDREVAEIIRNKFGVGAMEARRLVRTESAYIVNEMEQQSYEECDIDKYMFVATLDKRTSEICQSMDHKVFKVKDRKPGVNCPPMHPFCRSTTIAYLNDETISKMERLARDTDTGKTYKIPGNMSYEEWYEKYVAIDLRKRNAVKAHKNKYTDKKQYERYKNVLCKEDVADSLTEFQEIKYNDIEKWDNLKKLYRATNNGWILQKRLDYTWQGKVEFLPTGVALTDIHTIAGKGSNTPLRLAKSLSKKFGGNIDGWSKKVAKVTSDKYIFDVHWYEYDKEQYLAKVKFRKDRD